MYSELFWIHVLTSERETNICGSRVVAAVPRNVRSFDQYERNIDLISCERRTRIPASIYIYWSKTVLNRRQMIFDHLCDTADST